MKKFYSLYDGDVAYGLYQADDLDEFNRIKSSLEERIAQGDRNELKGKYDSDLYIVESTEIMNEDYMRDHKKDTDMDDWPDDAIKLYALSVLMEYFEALVEEEMV